MDANIIKKYDGQYITMSNELIQSKQKTNLLESKLEVLAIKKFITRPLSMEKTDSEGNPYIVKYVQIHVKEITPLISRTGGSIYTDIFNICLALKQKVNIILDHREKRYLMQSLYLDVGYNNGTISVEFNPETEYLFNALKDNYTKLSLPILFSFKTNGGFQLYKQLESYAFKLPPVDVSLLQEEMPSLTVSFNYAEFKLITGYVNINQPELKKEGSRANPNFEKMMALEYSPMYKKYSRFKNAVIEPGIEEINEISDIYISEFFTDSSGQGSKVNTVSFVIQRNVLYYANLAGETEDREVIIPNYVVTEEDIKEILKMMKSMPLTAKDAEILIKEAKGNLELIREAYEISKTQDHIMNFIGWMRTCIKNNYRKPVETMKGSTERVEVFHEYKKQSSKIDFQETVWNKLKERDDFKEFLSEIGYSAETLEMAYIDPKERVSLYTEWKIHKTDKTG